jgi:hypothetical protein
MIKFDFMKSKAIKLIFMFLISTFSLFWISEKLTVFLENEEHSYFEVSEKNEVEAEVKNLFIDQIELFDLEALSLFDSQKINSFYCFKVKKCSFKKSYPSSGASLIILHLCFFESNIKLVIKSAAIFTVVTKT